MKRMTRSLRTLSIRRRRGSIVLMLCVMATPLILILSTLFIGAQIKAAELDVDRALSALVQTRLSGFDKALYEEFGLLALSSDDKNDTFQRILPNSVKGLAVRQEPSRTLSDPETLKSSILTYMRLRLPASLIKTIADQTGFRVTSARPAPGLISSLMPDDILDDFSRQVKSAVWHLLSKAVYEFLDDEIKEALKHYQRFAAECASYGSHGQQMVAYPDIFDPSQIRRFTDIISQSMTVGNVELADYLAVREYILTTFWHAGQPTHPMTVTAAGIIPSADLLEHRNLSGVPMKNYPGREAGEVEQILTGAQSPKSGISQVKSLLVMFRTALYLFHQLSRADGMAAYRLTAVGLSGLVATVSAGTIVIDPEIVAYLLLVCDALRQGFADYAKLMKGDRLAFSTGKSAAAVRFDYVMHLRILLFLSPESKLLQRAGNVIGKRYPGSLYTDITVRCTFRGRERMQQGSLMTIGGAA